MAQPEPLLPGESQPVQVEVSQGVVVRVEFQNSAFRLRRTISHLRDADDRLPPPLRIDRRPDLQVHSVIAPPRLKGESGRFEIFPVVQGDRTRRPGRHARYGKR